MNVSKLWRYGSICLLMLSSVFSSHAKENCQQTFEASKAGVSAALSFSGSCERGMFQLALTMPEGQQQTLYEAYHQPISAIWLEKLTGKPQPDLVMLLEADGHFKGLLVYSWVNNHYQKLAIKQPEASLLEGYDQQDRVYVRWGELVRQIKLADPDSAGWRRLRYDFAQKLWVESN
ncbi:hypothetical protein K0504_01535 [Neiella marina]|uniref:Uncharacterized protein n=1 Tax=Neiella holothuriorum TaxID=2870530 RepID=A0ABS7EBJ4_9GAMM|nr:hypothetical protein [Neiella holothuriorum]MBW8189703.1 hypothetical protein [Neiella holothuriorum]